MVISFTISLYYCQQCATLIIAIHKIKQCSLRFKAIMHDTHTVLSDVPTWSLKFANSSTNMGAEGMVSSRFSSKRTASIPAVAAAYRERCEPWDQIKVFTIIIQYKRIIPNVQWDRQDSSSTSGSAVAQYPHLNTCRCPTNRRWFCYLILKRRAAYPHLQVVFQIDIIAIEQVLLYHKLHALLSIYVLDPTSFARDVFHMHLEQAEKFWQAGGVVLL